MSLKFSDDARDVRYAAALHLHQNESQPLNIVAVGALETVLKTCREWIAQELTHRRANDSILELYVPGNSIHSTPGYLIPLNLNEITFEKWCHLNKLKFEFDTSPFGLSGEIKGIVLAELHGAVWFGSFEHRLIKKEKSDG